MNYIDFKNAFKQRNDFIDIARISLEKLSSKIDLGLSKISLLEMLERHRRGETDLHRELQLLISLEMSLSFKNDNGL